MVPAALVFKVIAPPVDAMRTAAVALEVPSPLTVALVLIVEVPAVAEETIPLTPLDVTLPPAVTVTVPMPVVDAEMPSVEPARLLFRVIEPSVEIVTLPVPAVLAKMPDAGVATAPPATFIVVPAPAEVTLTLPESSALALTATMPLFPPAGPSAAMFPVE